jgi:uncharacterized lipoprotein YajG
VKAKRLVWLAGVGLIFGCATSSPSTQTRSPEASSAQAQAVAADSGEQSDATAAESGTQEATASGATVATVDKDKTLVCEDQQVTGSRIPKKVCRTLRQIEQEREAAQKSVRESERVNRRLGD